MARLTVGDGNNFTDANAHIILQGEPPIDEGRTANADQIIARLRPKLARVPGITLYMQAGQDINVGGRLARTQYQYTLTDTNLAELNDWTPRIVEKLQALPQLAAARERNPSDRMRPANPATTPRGHR